MKKVFRILGLVIFSILLIMFIIPLYKGILNLGNFFGILICLFADIMLVFSKNTVSLFKKIISSVLGRVITIIVGTIILFLVICCAVFTCKMFGSINNTTQNDYTLVILGCKVNGTNPSVMLTQRLEAGYNYLIEHPDVKCICSGGQGKDEFISEAQSMKTYLLNRGITEDRIILEDKSKNTAENFEFTKKLLDENGLDNKVVVSSNGFHLYRASLYAEEFGIEMYSIKADTSYYQIPTMWVREWIAIAYTKLFE